MLARVQLCYLLPPPSSGLFTQELGPDEERRESERERERQTIQVENIEKLAVEWVAYLAGAFELETVHLLCQCGQR